MMRWLKDKKREKRSNSVGCDDEDDDDYGFEKEKTTTTMMTTTMTTTLTTTTVAGQAASKSPLTRRQLPPTPLTPEEKSPHIYEEIHDGQVVYSSSAAAQSGSSSTYRVKRLRHGSAGGAAASSASVSSGSYIASSSLSSKYIGNGNDAMLSASSAKDDSISPYMVVPVDEEVRQTPTNFHRNGTPEVHCDVIVKETHCEIFLSRKPKVSAFKPDANAVGVERDAYPSSGNLVSNGNPTIRNNTHFCSRNRRASVDVHSIGGKSNNSSSGGPWNSSAFSSSSTSRVNSVGASMMSLSTLSERDNRLPSLDDNASSGSSAKGVLTYTVGGNTIARATKLTFNPLKPMDGDDTSLSNLDPFFTMMPPPPSSSDSSVFADVATASPPSIPNPTSPATLPTGRLSNQVDNTNSPIVYSTMSAPSTHPPNTNNFAHQPYLQGHLNPDSQPQQSSTTTPKSSSNFVHDSVPPSTISNPASNRGYNPEQPFHPHIRASSPSNASSCTYASVSFPTEPKIYNTIAPDLISKESTRELQSHTVLRHLESSIEGESETESVRYSSIQDTTTPSFGNMGIPGNQTMPNATIPILPPENSGEIFQFGAACVGADDSVYSGVMAYRIDPESTNLLSPGCCAGTTLLSQSQLYSSGEQSRTTSTNNNNIIASSVSTTYNSTLSGNHTHPIPHNSAPNVVPSDSSSIIYSGIINQNEAVMNDECSDNISLYASIENNSNFEHNNPSCVNGVSDNTLNGSINKVANSTTNNISIDTSEADVDRLLYGEAAGMAAAASAAAAVAVSASVTNSLLLDFCTCSDDQHSSGCGGFMDGKADDDTSSIATTINEPRGPCTGCGRLIRQITYSESYSDETYEHVYSSRLLLRRGRRYSSPDITGSEISNSETNREFDEVKGQCHFGTMSRDDTWMTSRHDYAPHTFYRQSDSDAPVVNTNLLLNQIHGVQSATDQVQSSIPSPANSNPAAKPRQSFSAFGLTTKNPNILRDNSTGVSILAHHRSSLPAINPSNLVPVTDVVAPSTTTSQLHTKGSAFSNLLSKFSRPKLRHANRVNEVAPLVASAKHNQIPNIESTPADAKLSNVCTPSQNPAPSDAPIPEKNTTKLSKFFQRLSNSDVGEGKEEMKNGKDNKKREEDFKTKALNVEIPDCSASNVITSTTANTNNNIDTTNTNTNSNNTKLLQSPPCENISSDPSVTQYGAHISAFKGKSNLSPNASKPGADNPNAQIKPEDVSILLDVSSSDHSPGRQPTRITSAQTNTNEALVDTIIMGENKTAIGASSAGCDEVNAMNVGSEPNARPQNKTDSGDTCYEYDISTSSESEQTSYDYFLSKVKKSLNLEHEVQQIADMSNLRKKAFCKKCKRSDLYGSSHAVDADDNESVGSDGGCPHLSAKFGDLRKIFGDFVVDQRAAILDCLTDYAHGPFNVKGEGRENTCRGCGGEIMTSDSESMTTVYSILSQQFRMTSPGTHTPSCDSDDGTMADNSCESADDEDNDVSSGYDEATGPICEHYSSHKTKRKEKSRERKERKLHHSSGNVASSCRDHEKSLKKKNSAHGAAHSKTDGGKSGGNNSNFKRHHGAADNNNKYIVSENKHQSRQKQDTVHSIDTSIHSSSTTAFQKNSLRKEGSSTGNQSHCGPSFNNSNNNNNNNNNSNNNDNNNMGAQISNNSHPKNNNIYNQSGADSKHVCDQLFKHGEAETVSLSNVNNTSDTTNSNSGTTSTTNKPRPRLLATEKVIQDIYAPLPSKALSWLTARCCINNNPLISNNNNNNNNNINSNNQEEHPNIFTSPSCSSANLATVEPNTSTTNFIQNSQVTESPDKGTKVTNVIPSSLPTHNHDNPTVVGGTVTCKAPGHRIAIAATTTTTTTTPCSSSSSCFNNNNNKHNSLDSMQTRCDVLQTKEGDNSSASLVTVGGTAATIDDPPHKGTRQYADGHKLPAELKDGDRLEYNVEVGVGDIEGKSSERGDVCSADNTQTRLSAPGKFVTPLIDGSERTRPLIDTSKCSVDSRAGSTPDRKQSKDTEIGGHGNQARIPIPDVLTSRQKQKQLQMAALDLLPETVLGSDVDDVSLRNECGNAMEATVSQKDQQQQQQQQQQQRIKSKRVERLAKMFENNSNSNSSPCLASTLKSENNSNSSRKKPSASESTMTTTSLSATTTTNIAGGDTRGVTKFTDAITSTATAITGTTTNNSSGRSFINKTATTAVATAMTWSSPQINTTTTIITTATTATTDIDNTTTMETRANRSDPVTIGQTPHVKPGTLPRPGPSPSIVKKPIFPSHSTAPSSSIPIPAPTTKSDHPVKSPLYHSRSCSSSLLSLPSSSPQTSDKNVLDKNQAFNTNTNTLESNSGTTPGPPGPPATNKPVLCNKTSSILQTKSKFERSRKIESRKGREQNSSDNDRETQTRDTTPKSSKDKSKRIVSGNEPTRRRFKPQDSESDSKPSTTTSTTSRKQLVSPSLSTSSGSSSKRNRNGTGSTSNGGGSGNTTRQKKLSKRGHPHRRARSKSERRHKSSHHHHQHGEERTRYYFSSDLSDIDVIEVEDWETYSSSRAVGGSTAAASSNSNANSTSRDLSSGKSNALERRKRLDKESSRKSRSTADVESSSFAEDSGDHSMIQEVYSIPPNSSEIRGGGAIGGVVASAAADIGSASSPQMSPDVATKLPKKSKKSTDAIYKTKKNNNKLLSDLIIRNYDRQMYDVGNGYNENSGNGCVVNNSSGGNV